MKLLEQYNMLSECLYCI